MNWGLPVRGKNVRVNHVSQFRWKVEELAGVASWCCRRLALQLRVLTLHFRGRVWEQKWLNEALYVSDKAGHPLAGDLYGRRWWLCMSWRFDCLRSIGADTWTGSISCFDYEFVELVNGSRDEHTLRGIRLLALRIWGGRRGGLAFRHLASLATKGKTQSLGL